MYVCVENTFITIKWRSSARRSASLPALHEPGSEALTDLAQVESLEKRASLSHPEARKTNGCAEQEAPSRVPSFPPSPKAGRNERQDVASPLHGPSVNLDKQQRQALRSLSERERLSLVVAHLRAWAEKVPRAGPVVDLMEQHLACLEVPKSSSSSRLLKSLSRAMRKMSFNRLMQMCPCSKLEPIQSASLQLRASYGEATD